MYHSKIIPVAAHHDQTGEYPWEVIKELHSIGLLNPHIAEKYGGMVCLVVLWSMWCARHGVCGWV